MYTRQQILDRVREVFVVNKAPPSQVNGERINGRCLYAPAINGVGCAIGCLLPSGVGELWDKLPSSGIDAICESDHSSYRDLFAPEDIDFLSDLQTLHDYSFTEGAPEYLQAVAETLDALGFTASMDVGTRAIAAHYGLAITN